MGKLRNQIVLALFLGLLLPTAIFCAVAPPTEPVTEETSPSVEKKGREEQEVTVVFPDGEQKLPLDEYLVGVVMGEMPASFEMEALKAQAVVARTYTLRRMNGGKHQSGVCTDPGCCQAYVPPERGSQEENEKIRSAVEETAGLVVVYQGELIDATYFSCSGGSTEDAAAVWGSDIPYLQATDSPGEENAAPYSQEFFIPAGEFCDALDLSGGWDEIGSISYTDGGGVDEMEIGGRLFSGTELRKKLSLPSTIFTVYPEENGMRICTRGFGHRVGMSQYGADAMAAGGATFQEILLHYYKGCQVILWDEN